MFWDTLRKKSYDTPICSCLCLPACLYSSLFRPASSDLPLQSPSFNTHPRFPRLATQQHHAKPGIGWNGWRDPLQEARTLFSYASSMAHMNLLSAIKSQSLRANHDFLHHRHLPIVLYTSAVPPTITITALTSTEDPRLNPPSSSDDRRGKSVRAARRSCKTRYYCQPRGMMHLLPSQYSPLPSTPPLSTQLPPALSRVSSILSELVPSTA